MAEKMSIYNNPIVKAWRDNCNARVEFISYLRDMYSTSGLAKLLEALKGTKCDEDVKGKKK